MDQFHIPEPAKIAPALTKEERANMPPIDLLVQYIMPKLWDRVAYLEWETRKKLYGARQEFEGVCGQLRSNIEQLEKKVNALERNLTSAIELNTKLLNMVKDKEPVAEQVSGNVKRRRKKGPEKLAEAEPAAVETQADVSAPVAVSAVARYDSQTDEWKPKVVMGMEITARVVSDIVDPTDGEELAYPPEVVAFVMDLSEGERKVICDMFAEK